MNNGCHCEERSDEAIHLDFCWIAAPRSRGVRNDKVGKHRGRAPALRSLGEAGFTILELLVAASITALLAAFIAVIIGNVATSWSRASGRLGADAQARLVLDQLQLDLQGAIFRDDGNVWLAANVVDNTSNTSPPNLWTEAARNVKPTGTGANGSVNLTTPNIADARFGKAGIWLRFFTTKRGSNTSADATSISAPVAVGYQIIRRFAATNPANTVNQGYLLHRAEVRPAATGTGSTARPGVLETGYKITDGAYSNVSTSTNDGSVTGDPRGIMVPGSNSGAARNLDAVIADNVIDFGVRFYVRDATQPGGLRLIFPADAAGKPTGTANSRHRASLPSSTPPDATNFGNLMPDVVDVMLRVLTDDGAALIANIEKNQTPTLTVPLKYNGNAQAWWWGVATENSRVFTRRIVLNAKSL